MAEHPHVGFGDPQELGHFRNWEPTENSQSHDFGLASGYQREHASGPIGHVEEGVGAGNSINLTTFDLIDPRDMEWPARSAPHLVDESTTSDGEQPAPEVCSIAPETMKRLGHRLPGGGSHIVGTTSSDRAQIPGEGGLIGGKHNIEGALIPVAGSVDDRFGHSRR